MAQLKAWCAACITGALILTQQGSTCSKIPHAQLRYSRMPAAKSRARVSAGQLGIISDSWDARDLVVAYRYLAGTPLTPREQASYLRQPDFDPTAEVAAAKRLKGSLEKLLGRQLQWWSVDRRVSHFVTVQNCTAGAFATASATLAARSRQFGEKSEWVRRWAAAQSAVFDNCQDGAALPPEPEPDLPELFRWDREYQIAAAHFYAMQYDEARRRFRIAAAHPASPWRNVADLMVARADLRQATAREGAADEGLLRRAEQHLRRLLADPDRLAIHPSARRLVNFVAVRLRPKERGEEIEQELLTPDASPDFGQNVADYVWLTAQPFGQEKREPKYTSQTKLAQWLGVLTNPYSGPRCAGGETALALVAEPYCREQPHWERWMLAAGRIAEGPALPTLAHGRAMGMMRHNPEEARRLLTQMLTRQKQLPPEEENAFRELRLRLARNTSEFVIDAPRRPTASRLGENPVTEPLPMLDEDAVHTLNESLPLRSLLDIAKRNTWPPRIQAQLWGVVWTRALELGRFAELQTATPEVLKRTPTLAPYAAEFAAAKTPLAQRYALVRFLWAGEARGISWMMETSTVDQLWLRSEPNDPNSTNSAPSAKPAGFLTATEQVEWRQERAARQLDPRLAAAAAVLAYARAYPEDGRVPEDLHRLVQSGKSAPGSPHSRAAFLVLHQRYPNSPWTARTPFWY